MNVHVYGSVKMGHGSRCRLGRAGIRESLVVTCELLNGKDQATCEFLKSQIEILSVSPGTALIELPAFFVPIFKLERLVLSERQVEHYRGIAKCYNAPYLPPTPERRVEKVGGIGI